MLRPLIAALTALHFVASAAVAADRHISIEDLYAAFQAGDLETVMAFKAKDEGTDFVFYGRSTATLLHSAAIYNQPRIAAALMDDGLPVNIRTKRKLATPLAVAGYFCALETGLLFLARGAEVNAVNKDGFTALIAAVWGDCPELIGPLLDHGADPMIAARGRSLPEDERGFRAVDFARKHNPALLETRAGKRLVAQTEAGEGCDGARAIESDTTLEKLAARVLGDADKWRAIAKANNLGSDGYRLGDCLKLPA
ncbi:MAG: ankyrin repeat domain-containing protein [Boseongicola sp. SB0677_bin_26]|nr:ankyrin repeat domain-containing protein [Boseongicola sp. SB0665_bin_10]MYG28025.1 ankyrin repeat domain-containing protein [Boseongicola sp. SB0677_bin_26]